MATKKKSSRKTSSSKPKRKVAAKAKPSKNGKPKAKPQEDAPETAAVETEPAGPPKSLDELKAEHYEKIRTLNKEVSIALAQSDADARVAKSSKKRYETLSSNLVELIESDPAQRELPFPGTIEPDRERKAPSGSNEWRGVLVSELGIGGKATGLLENSGIENLGQLQDFWDQDKRLFDLKGIGPEIAGEIADAYSDYGAKHPELWNGKTDGDDLTLTVTAASGETATIKGDVAGTLKRAREAAAGENSDDSESAA